MKRGIVMSIQDNHAVVMTQDGQFLKAPLKGSPAIGQELVFEEEAGHAPRPRTRIVRSRLMRYVGSAAAVLLLVAACLVYAAAKADPVVAYVTMDINPSIEIGIDDQEKVRRLRAMNEDGRRLIEDIEYKGQQVEAVATRILEKASNAHYLDAPHKDILIASILMNGSKVQSEEFEKLLTQSLDDKLNSWLAEHDKLVDSVTITTLFVPAELRSEADSNGISAGKMALYLMAKNEGYSIELDSLKAQSIDKATASIGGVGHILGDAEDPTTKAKLQQLLKKEQEEKNAASAKPTDTAAVKPTQKPTNKPANARPTSKPTVKPAAKPSAKPTKRPVDKPGAAVKPGFGAAGNWGDFDDWKQWSDKWKNERNKEELEKLMKEWEKAGKDWREQWRKWEEDQKSQKDGKGDKGSGPGTKGNGPGTKGSGSGTKGSGGKNGTSRGDDKDRSNDKDRGGRGGSAGSSYGGKGDSRDRDGDRDNDRRGRDDDGRKGDNKRNGK